MYDSPTSRPGDRTRTEGVTRCEGQGNLRPVTYPDPRSQYRQDDPDPRLINSSPDTTALLPILPRREPVEQGFLIPRHRGVDPLRRDDTHSTTSLSSWSPYLSTSPMTGDLVTQVQLLPRYDIIEPSVTAEKETSLRQYT